MTMSDPDNAAKLRTELRHADPDGFYEELIDMNKGLTEAEALKVAAKLVLLLANHIGDIEVLREAMAAARKGVEGTA